MEILVELLHNDAEDYSSNQGLAVLKHYSSHISSNV